MMVSRLSGLGFTPAEIEAQRAKDVVPTSMLNAEGVYEYYYGDTFTGAPCKPSDQQARNTVCAQFYSVNGHPCNPAVDTGIGCESNGPKTSQEVEEYKSGQDIRNPFTAWFINPKAAFESLISMPSSMGLEGPAVIMGKITLLAVPVAAGLIIYSVMKSKKG